MTNKKQIKDKLAIRKKLIRYNYELEYKDSVRKGLEIFNDITVGEIWTRKADFIITKCDFDWKAIHLNKNLEFICDCEVYNKNTNSYYNASIISNSESKNKIQNKIQQRLGTIEYECTIICKLFDFEYITEITISQESPCYLIFDYDNHKKHFDDLIKAESGDDEEDEEEDDDRDKDYDWKRDNFNALTDGQYGDFDDFNDDWDRLDEWRGA